MATVYRVIAIVIAALVGLQAASHAWVSAGLGLFIERGGVIDKAFLESAGADGTLPFPEMVGFMIHGMNGMIVIPIVTLLLLVASFFVGARRAVIWAAVVAALVALQVTLGLNGHGMPMLAFLHGINALLLFGSAVFAVRAARTSKNPMTGTATQARSSVHAEA